MTTGREGVCRGTIRFLLLIVRGTAAAFCCLSCCCMKPDVEALCRVACEEAASSTKLPLLSGTSGCPLLESSEARLWCFSRPCTGGSHA